MEIILQPSPEEASRLAARIVAAQIRKRPDSVLGLATGDTPRLLYQELIRMHWEEHLDFSRVTSFNLDEYVGLPADHPQSYHHYMQREFFQHVNIPPANTHLPDGRAEDVNRHCEEYERLLREAGGLDIQILGIGSDGHVGFNEPSSSLASRTRIKTLTRQTLADNARFFEREDEQPHHVITMGIGTILEARHILLLAFGESKANAVAASVEGPVSSMMPASALQFHPRACFLLDDAAAGHLSRADYYRWVYENKPVWQRS